MLKNFRTLAQTKKNIETLQQQIKLHEQYISLIENYKPQTLTQHVIHQYALEGNIARTADNLNRRGYDIEGRIIELTDISSIIKSKPAPDDLLHKEVRRLYRKKTKCNTHPNYIGLSKKSL